MVKGIIFDFDGTLFDSMYLWEQAGAVYLRSVNRKPEARLSEILKPLSLSQAAAYLQSAYALPFTPEEIMAGINGTVEHFYFQEILPKPGVTDLLEQLQARGIPMCIATATDRYQIEAALGRCRMEGFFSHIFTCTQTGQGKDSPEIYLQAARALSSPVEKTLVAEDALYGAKTAKAAGFPLLGIYDPYEPEQEALRTLSDCYLTSFQEADSFWKFAQGL